MSDIAISSEIDFPQIVAEEVDAEMIRQRSFSKERLEAEFQAGAKESRQGIIKMAVSVRLYENMGNQCILPRPFVNILRGIADKKIIPAMGLLWMTCPYLANRASNLKSLQDQNKIALDRTQTLYHLPESTDGDPVEEPVVPSEAKTHQIDQLIDSDKKVIRNRDEQIAYERRLHPRSRNQFKPQGRYEINQRKKMVTFKECEISFAELKFIYERSTGRI